MSHPRRMVGHMDTDAPRWSRAEEFYGRLGIPVPAPLTAEERADLDRRQDQADAELERILGLGPASAAA